MEAKCKPLLQGFLPDLLGTASSLGQVSEQLAITDI